MNVKKAIKRIVALGAGLTMIGATIMGATALTLGDYPQPFVKNGIFSGKIVVGQQASPADVLGAIDIAASLQAAAKTAVSVAGTGATSTVDNGVILEDSNNQDFNYGDTISTTAFDDQDFPTLLKDGTLEDDDGDEYDFTQEIALTGQSLKYGLVDNNVYENPLMYLDLSSATSFITFTVDFTDSVSWLALDDSEALDIFGTSWTVKDIATGGDFVLYGSDVTQLVSLNKPVDVTVDGKKYTLNVVGANSDDSSVLVSVNGNVKSMTQGSTKTIDGLKVYVQDVFISNVAGQDASAKLFIGSKELDLGAPGVGWTQVQEDNNDLEGVEVRITGTETAVTKLEFRIDPTSIKNTDLDEDYDWLALGDTFVDPIFGFQINFVEAVPGFTDSSRDYVELKSSNDDFQVVFTNENGAKYTFSPYQYTTAGNITAGDNWVASGTAVAKNEMFILYEDATSAKPVSRIFKFTGTTDSDTKANFKDTGSGQTYTVNNGSSLAKTGVTITTGDDTITLGSAVNNTVHTDSGMMIVFPVINQDATSFAFDLTLYEDQQGKNKDEVTGGNFNVTVSYDEGSDDEFEVSRPDNLPGSNNEDDDKSGDVYYGVSTYGTYYVQDADKSTWLKLYVPPEDVDYHIYLAAPDAAVISAGGNEGGTYYNVNPLAVGIAVLDVNAPTLGSTPLIVVGGPCANTVAAELMGNPTPCGEGFEAGKAFIKFYDAKSAVLVAGYEAMETQGASRVLADYADYGLTGTDVEVVVPTLSSITINKLA